MFSEISNDRMMSIACGDVKSSQVRRFKRRPICLERNKGQASKGVPDTTIWRGVHARVLVFV